jgi:hypothetical protein
MSDILGTDAAIWNSHDKSFMDGSLCRQLEHKLNAAQASVAQRDLTLATLCDMVLGEDAKDRSDDALMAGVRRMINRVTELEAWIRGLYKGEAPMPGVHPYLGPHKPEGLR